MTPFLVSEYFQEVILLWRLQDIDLWASALVLLRVWQGFCLFFFRRVVQLNSDVIRLPPLARLGRQIIQLNVNVLNLPIAST